MYPRTPRLYLPALLLMITPLAGCANRTGSPAPPAAVAAASEEELLARYFQALVRAEPAHWRAWVRLAALHTQAGRHREAFEGLRTAASLSPRNIGLHSALAEAADSAGYLDWALYGWNEVARLDRRDAFARVRLAQLYRRLDWIAEADAVLAQAVRLAPNSLEVLRERAVVDGAAGLRISARQWAERLVKEHPRSPYGYSLLADSHAQAGRWRDAVEQGRAAAQRAPKESSFLIRLAQYHLLRTDTPDPEMALKLLDQARNLAPEDPGALYWTGIALRRQGKTAEAQRALESVYARDPEFAAVRLQLADLYRLAGRHELAARYAKEGGEAQSRSRRQSEARAKLRQQPLSARAHRVAGHAYLETDEPALAVVEYLVASRLDPRDTAARKGLDEALRKQERPVDSAAPLIASKTASLARRE